MAGAGGNGDLSRPSLTAPPSLLAPKPTLSLPYGESAKLPPVAQERAWNTSNLGLRLAADASAAASASILVAPLICVIDRYSLNLLLPFLCNHTDRYPSSIVTKASSGTSFTTCFRQSILPAVTRPHTFLVSKPFLLIFSVYASTYLTANTIDTLTATLKSRPANTVSSGPTKFVATSAVNMSLSICKDSYFARIFNGAAAAPSAAAAKIPKLSYALFAARDSLTIFASFNLPPLIGPQLAHLPPAIKKQFSRILSTEAGRNNTAQFIAPAAMQLFSTPVHLLGLDLFNRQGRLGFAERLARVTRDWGVSALARMGRIVPAFGVGGVVNGNVRRNLIGRLE